MAKQTTDRLTRDRLTPDPLARDRLARGIVLAVVGALGCARFQPVLPLHARTGDVDLALQYLRIGPAQALVFESHSTEPHVLQRGWLTVPTRVPCSGGAEVEQLVLDGGALPAGQLPPGRHDLEVRFSDGLQGYGLDVVLDLEIEGGACVRAPAISQVIPLAAEQRPLLAITTDLEGGADFAGLRAIFGFEVGAGLWAGPLLVTGQAGLGEAICNPSSCPKDGQGNLGVGLAVPLALEVRYPLAEGRLNRVGNALYVGARYGLTPVRLPTFAGDRTFTVQAFQGVLSWGFGDAVRGPFLHWERAVPFELAVPIGVLVDPGGPAHRATLFGGVEFRFQFPL